MGSLSVLKRGVPKTLAFAFGLRCNGRALDRVTKQKHRPNRQKLSKKSPKIVFTAPLDKFWTFFRHFSDMVDIPVFWAVQRFARYKVCAFAIARLHPE